MAFGIGCATSFSTNFDNSTWLSSESRVMPVFDGAITRAIESTSRSMAAKVEEESSSLGDRLDEIVASVNEDTDQALAEDTAENTTQEKAGAHSARTYPLSMDLKVQRGDTLISMLGDIGISMDDARAVVDSIRPIYNPRSLTAGLNISVDLDKEPDDTGNPVLARLSIPLSNIASVEVKPVPSSEKGRYDARKVELPVENKLVRSGGTIDSSLYETGVKSGIPPALLSELITAYSYDVDFQRDIRQGDALDVLFERTQTMDGEATGYGKVLFADLNLRSNSIKIYRYVDKSGDADYYNENGESMRKALLRTPVNGARITSRFGKRTHPILGYTKMHRGVDFGAPTGTPIYAAGDGIVEYAGNKGGYGNYVRIRHNGTYKTAYGHISRFAKGLSSGKKVKQGQIIAYVGSTGMATGPHLHYEVLQNNAQVNPAGVKFKTGTVLKGKELLAFKQKVDNIHKQLASVERYKPLVVADASNSKSNSKQ